MPSKDDKAAEPKAAAAPAAADAGQAEVQARVDEEQAAGLRGVKVDPTPNENYTLPGQAAGLPTPETEDE